MFKNVQKKSISSKSMSLFAKQLRYATWQSGGGGCGGLLNASY
jgi:hypothetical protein